MKASDVSVSPLVDPSWLVDRLSDPNLRVIDCWRPEAYERAHIAGSVHIGADYWLKELRADGSPRGLHLMALSDLEALFGSLGVSADRSVVTYDDNGGRAAARVWWVLRLLGHTKASVLNGGSQAWLDEGLSMTHRTEPASPTAFSANLALTRVAFLADVVKALEVDDIQIVDARSEEEWTGIDLHGNRRGGHIPKALHLEWSDLLTPTAPWRFVPLPELRDRMSSVGVDFKRPVITYCQGGVRAAHVAFALELAGHPDVRVYDGSMEEWANREDMPLVTAR